MMIVIRFLLKILLAPVMLVITALTFVMGVFLALSKSVLSIVSSLFMFLALLLFLSGNWQNGFIMVGIAWAVSPFGLPWIAECCWKGVDNLRGFVWRLVF